MGKSAKNETHKVNASDLDFSRSFQGHPTWPFLACPNVYLAYLVIFYQKGTNGRVKNLCSHEHNFKGFWNGIWHAEKRSVYFKPMDDFLIFSWCWTKWARIQNGGNVSKCNNITLTIVFHRNGFNFNVGLKKKLISAKKTFLTLSMVTLAIGGHKTTSRAAKWLSTGKLKLSRVTSGYGGDILPVHYRLSNEN